MSEQWTKLGTDLVDGAIRQRKSVGAAYLDLLEVATDGPGKSALGAACSRCLAVAWDLKERGLRFQPELPIFSQSRVKGMLEINRLLSGGKLEAEQFFRTVAKAATMIDAAVQGGYFALDTNENNTPAEPIKVEVVSMPTRSTVTTITRDGNGNIKQSQSVELDV